MKLNILLTEWSNKETGTNEDEEKLVLKIITYIIRSVHTFKKIKIKGSPIYKTPNNVLC